MRDIFAEIFENQPIDPRSRHAGDARANRRKRFYRAPTSGRRRGRLSGTLDGKPVRTPARRALAAPTGALAERIAEEWNAQEDVSTRAHAAHPPRQCGDRRGGGKPAPVAEEIVKYLGSDLLFYRADGRKA